MLDIKSSDLAKDLVKLSDKQSADEMCAKSTIPCVAFESYELFLSALATGLWTQ